MEDINMKDNVIKLIKLGKIPNDDEMSDDTFDQYDSLIQMNDSLTFEEAELLITLFSDDCDDLNWGLLHLIETIEYHNIDRYRELISKCNNADFKGILKTRLNNYIENNK